jgi:hypothetical protein
VARHIENERLELRPLPGWRRFMLPLVRTHAATRSRDFAASSPNSSPNRSAAIEIRQRVGRLIDHPDYVTIVAC